LERLLSLRVFNSDSELEAVLGELTVLSNEFHLVFPHLLLNPLAHHLFHYAPPLRELGSFSVTPCRRSAASLSHS
jgi:hypothetical protein